ncbi:TadE/TadG family type IV pilus assembly protein [Terricaulis silvestris]|uniref:Flp pilus assembly protein TadG n=1 Tax=Terricaulis silvestris TaxID=2686094 RepID=A0A6I6MS86_9CAUL|nr:pilus assembly protein [Terricaulis silvestris]QGZ96286.1 Flp pilus assembly protein TadG [Terricaulis silvestris]
MVTQEFIGERSARAFGRDRRGNVAMMWGLMGAVLVGLIGITVDFTRAQALRNQMQNAVDGAALVAERSSNLTLAQRQAAAEAFFDAEMGDLATGATFTITHLDDGGHMASASMPMPLSLARVIKNQDWDIAVQAVAEANASPPIEVALVLDNTGSMSADMDGLRSAASDLVGDLLSIDGDTVRVALVPFVAQVNIGNEASHLAWMDQAGQAAYNGEILEDRSIAYRARTTSGTGNTGNNCQNISTLPFTGYPGSYRITWRRGDASLLGGLLGSSGGQANRCYAWTPSDGINYLTLFDLLPNDDWKGCVEARPEPYDVTDAAPNIGTPDTMFVPFFWLDTVDNGVTSSNSYITDSQGNITSATMSSRMSSGSGTANDDDGLQARMFNVFKYRNNSASIDASPPDTRGPNRGCPTPIVPLTTNENLLQTNVAAMRHWSGGGTNQAEGLAWGWRVLSPNAPFSEGAAYGPNVRKVIVLMSDGENTNVGSDPVLDSDYSAYNHLGVWTDLADGGLLGQLIGGIVRGILAPQYRRNISSSTSYVSYVNQREATLCTNIKNAGIEIYTVIFRETDQATETLMRNCASSDENFFRADNAQELSEAFDAIGSGIGQLRLTH